MFYVFIRNEMIVFCYLKIGYNVYRRIFYYLEDYLIFLRVPVWVAEIE